jgi:hypothetical protein
LKKKILYISALFLIPLISFSQDITGVWKGELYVDSTKKHYPFELSVSEFKGKYSGYSRISFEENGTRQVVFRDHTIKINNNEVIVEDDSQLTKASSVLQPKEVKKVMQLTLNTTDSTMQLNGTWSTNKTRRFLAATGSVSMQRKIDFKSTDLYKKLNELALTDKLSFDKPPVSASPAEEITLKLDKLNLSVINTIEIPRKKISVPAKVTRPNPLIRPTEILIAKIKKEPLETEIKKIPVTVATVKKPVSPEVKPSTVIKPTKVAIVKKETPPISKTAPVSVVDKPAAPEIKPAEKRNVVLPEQKNAAVDVAKRSVNSMQSVFFKSDSLQITLYDNGEIDGDTVSVLLNGKVIIAKQGLTTKPNLHTIYFDRNTPDSQMLVMYAENLGAIPPNTGLLVVREGSSVYEVRFSADLKTNAAIILRRKKEE